MCARNQPQERPRRHGWTALVIGGQWVPVGGHPQGENGGCPTDGVPLCQLARLHSDLPLHQGGHQSLPLGLLNRATHNQTHLQVLCQLFPPIKDKKVNRKKLFPHTRYTRGSNLRLVTIHYFRSGERCYTWIGKLVIQILKRGYGAGSRVGLDLTAILINNSNQNHFSSILHLSRVDDTVLVSIKLLRYM